MANSVTQTRMTHDNKVVIGTSAFIAHCLWILTHSTQMPSQVIPSVAKLLATTYPDTVQLVNQGIARLADFKTQLAKGKDGRFEGIACSVDGALPLAIQIVLNCEKGSLMDALVVNALIGGDTAARGMIVGMLISPRTGVPTSMLGQVKAYNQIQSRITELQNL